MTIGIVELATICESHEHRNRRLFEGLGGWVTSDTPPVGALGRLVTEACHRHAEHAGIWARRRPTIPVAVNVDHDATDVGEVSGYRHVLEALHADVVDVAARLDRDLDPSTHRVVEIVERDLASILARLDVLG